MKKPAKAEVTLLSDTEVRVTRRFNAPRKLVYKAYTTPALLKRWMVGSPGWSFPVCEMDLREGGSFVWRWQNDEDGKQFGFHGEFLEIEPPKRIVHSEFFDPMDIGGDMGEGTTVSLTFDEADGVTTLTTNMRFKSKADREAAMSTGMTDGMEMSYQLLDGLLLEQSAA